MQEIQISMREIQISMQEGTSLVWRNAAEVWRKAAEGSNPANFDLLWLLTSFSGSLIFQTLERGKGRKMRDPGNEAF